MFKYKNVLIYGYSTSGKSVERVLINMDVNYKIYDDNMRLGGGKYLFKLPKSEIKKFDLIVVSPAISIFNKNIRFAESEGIRVISELEFGFLLCPYPIIAVTGTNGKTTVTKLLEHVLNVSGYSVKALGNVGQPLTDVVNYQNLDFVVVEVSSFQLEATYKFKPYIGVLLNIDDDHIDRHKTFLNYTMLKTSLFKNCNADCYGVLGNQPEIVGNLKNGLFNKTILNKNCCVDNGWIIYENEKLFKLDDVNNFTFLDNILAVVSVLKIIGLENEKILMGINTFSGLDHRLEFVETIDDVTYYNDSKATNPHATLGATSKLEKEENITLLLGGVDKNFNFENLIEKLPNNVKRIVAFGKCRKKIFKACKGKIEVCVTQTLNQAVLLAQKITTKGCVLLSPACASFDEFSSYVERGNYFKNLVKSFKQTNNKKGEVC